ncbi:MAG: RNA polymerase sigma factor [Planctomycetes bacterium]|nr:RNA polymerase sigma factor [Planctomycetota bacterium]
MKYPNVPSSSGEGAASRDAAAPRRGPSVTSTSLLERLRNDEASSWRRLVRLYGSLVYSWCRRKGLQEQDAADVSQEVFRAVAVHIRDFSRDRSGDSFRRWLKTIANNKIRDHWRRRNRETAPVGGTEAHLQLEQVPDESDAESPADQQAEIGHVFRQALELVKADFEPVTWQAFWQTAVDGRAAADVAADLGITANAVRIAKSRVRSRLRQEFGELIEQPAQ